MVEEEQDREEDLGPESPLEILGTTSTKLFTPGGSDNWKNRLGIGES